MIPNNFIDFYGDQTRWFLGEVVNVKDDPLKLGRVRVRVHGVHDDIKNIKDADLPWAQIVVPVTQGVHDGKGQYLGILKGTQVFGVFLDGQNSQLPMVIGTVPKEGDENDKAEKNYPHNKVYQTDRGHYKEYDDTEGKERIKEHHTSGSYYEIQPDGTRLTVIEKDDILIVKGNCSITVVGDVFVSAGKSAVVNAVEDVTVSAGKSAYVSGKEKVSIVSKTVEINGSEVKLNS